MRAAIPLKASSRTPLSKSAPPCQWKSRYHPFTIPLHLTSKSKKSVDPAGLEPAKNYLIIGIFSILGKYGDNACI
jgi:hypothetical protein